MTNQNKEKKFIISNEQLMKEWNWEKNNKLGYHPHKLTLRSGKKVWWICEDGHEWDAIIANRTKGSGCPYCAGRKVLMGFNDLETVNPDLAREWNYEKNKNLTPKMVTSNSGKTVWWICNNGHEWQARISNRSKGSGCHYCTNQKILTGYNDLETICPELAKEWHPTKNGKLLPSQVGANSTKKVWWLCGLGHEWHATVINRHIHGSGCPICKSDMQTSFAEQAILFYLGKITNVNNRNTDFGKEIDIYLPDYKIGIEHNGKYYHKDRKQKDEEKVKYFSEYGIRIITINEGDTNYIDNDTIEYVHNKVWSGSLDWVINNLFIKLNLNCNSINIDVNTDAIKIWNQYIYSKKKCSLSTEYPDLSREWNYQKNGNLKPDMVSPHSSKKVWWICSECSYEWMMRISDRSRGSGCPMCTKKRISKIYSKPVYCKELDKQFPSVTEAEKVTGVKNIAMCCRGERKSAGKHPETGEKLTWKYI